MEYIIDRIENKLAVLELPDRSHITVPVKELPAGVQEGDVLIQGEQSEWLIDQKSTKKRRERIFRMMEQIFPKED
ncbi:Protein of uncharacterised function (DUF3006) [uncultured Ruminococcus sp.]|uniref:DUF3006 domain-containing protein n=1 Tax=Massiliimalia timonensis TaxID=1987501 RepID=A0A8J6PHG9_9FIRM|nr:DUF3006 domain-containing protein [Massiliimalia timonensis]MBC8610205.1 DUF3006 domain-containing protein [Massiliimalia timonensis]SCH04522.1 Protein of uncharacterised function (DUF3006) [uncultured Ruminococcus sp.]SCH74497.1 Protein of uncharacterised function (DUF3006) [uncultured Clostridium sp.]